MNSMLRQQADHFGKCAQMSQEFVFVPPPFNWRLSAETPDILSNYGYLTSMTDIGCHGEAIIYENIATAREARV